MIISLKGMSCYFRGEEKEREKERVMGSAEVRDVVIVGGGICGLATALALHRKGIKSVVLERSDTLRATGAAIGVFANGWRALHQLGLASTLQSTAIPFLRALDVWVDKGVVRETPISEGEARCLKRIDLVEALANELPLGTIRFGCQVLSVGVERSSSNPLLQLRDGSLIKAKVLLGCDGANSIIGNFIGLKPTQPLSKSAVRGLTIYPNGHRFAPEFLRMRKDKLLVGRIPVDEKTVYWFVVIHGNERHAEISKNSASIKQLTIDSTVRFPTEIVEMISNSDLNSLSLTRLRFRAPWDLLLGNFHRGTVTVAGDAWHVMGPFLGQGGSAALEDAIVLARCLSKWIYSDDSNGNQKPLSEHNAREALDEYLKERRSRVLHLSSRTYITGLLLVGDASLVVRFICIVIMAVLFRDRLNHTRYDCGEL